MNLTLSVDESFNSGEGGYNKSSFVQNSMYEDRIYHNKENKEWNSRSIIAKLTEKLQQCDLHKIPFLNKGSSLQNQMILKEASTLSPKTGQANLRARSTKQPDLEAANYAQEYLQQNLKTQKLSEYYSQLVEEIGEVDSVLEGSTQNVTMQVSQKMRQSLDL